MHTYILGFKFHADFGNALWAPDSLCASSVLIPAEMTTHMTAELVTQSLCIPSLAPATYGVAQQGASDTTTVHIDSVSALLPAA